MGAGGWKPIETAPRDGTRIIGWFGDRCIAVFWRSGPEYIRRRNTGKTVWYWSDGYSRFPEPECWQPEPAGPSNEMPWCGFCEARTALAEAAGCKSRQCPLKLSQAA